MRDLPGLCSRILRDHALLQSARQARSAAEQLVQLSDRLQAANYTLVRGRTGEATMHLQRAMGRVSSFGHLPVQLPWGRSMDGIGSGISTAPRKDNKLSSATPNSRDPRAPFQPFFGVFWHCGYQWHHLHRRWSLTDLAPLRRELNDLSRDGLLPPPVRCASDRLHDQSRTDPGSRC